MLKIMYNIIIEFLLNYGSFLWGSPYTYSLKFVIVIQKYIMKIMYGKPRDYSQRETAE